MKLSLIKKYLELSVIIIQFISSISTIILSIISLTTLEKIMNNNHYRYYISDFLKRSNYFLDFTSTKNSNTVYGPNLFTVNIMNCTEECLKVEIINDNLIFNKNRLFAQTISLSEDNIFYIINSTYTCDYGYKECFKNEYYKTF